jgi:hypothetical protein
MDTAKCRRRLSGALALEEPQVRGGAVANVEPLLAASARGEPRAKAPIVVAGHRDQRIREGYSVAARDDQPGEAVFDQLR